MIIFSAPGWFVYTGGGGDVSVESEDGVISCGSNSSGMTIAVKAFCDGSLEAAARPLSYPSTRPCS